jgi:hypothetical protein
MKRFLWALVLASAIGGMPNPTPADAATAGCLASEIDGCNEDFPNSSEYLIAIRGWCYLIRGAFCLF